MFSYTQYENGTLESAKNESVFIPFPTDMRQHPLYSKVNETTSVVFQGNYHYKIPNLLFPNLKFPICPSESLIFYPKIPICNSQLKSTKENEFLLETVCFYSLYLCNPKSNFEFCLKYQRFTPSGCIDLGIRKFELVAKTQFLYCI